MLALPDHSAKAEMLALGEKDHMPMPKIMRRVNLSAAQSRFWFLNLYAEDRTTSNVTFIYRIAGRVRVPALARAVTTVARNHESLRTCFLPDDAAPEVGWQGLMETSALKLEHYNLSSDSEAGIVSEYYDQVKNTHYDLSRGKTMRVMLLTLKPDSHAIIFGYHHIIMDGVGFQVFLRDLEIAYTGRQALPLPPLQYLDFSERQQQHRRMCTNGGVESKSMTYWRQELKDLPPLFPLLPIARVPSRQALDAYHSIHVQERLSPLVSSRIKTLCREARCTPSHFYLAVFRVLLTRIAGVQDVCVGMADANRSDLETMAMVGLCLNLLPVLFRGDSSRAVSEPTSVTFQTVLQSTRDKVYEALGHSDVAIDEILQGESRSFVVSMFFGQLLMCLYRSAGFASFIWP